MGKNVQRGATSSGQGQPTENYLFGRPLNRSDFLKEDFRLEHSSFLWVPRKEVSDHFRKGDKTYSRFSRNGHKCLKINIRSFKSTPLAHPLHPCCPKYLLKFIRGTGTAPNPLLSFRSALSENPLDTYPPGKHTFYHFFGHVQGDIFLCCVISLASLCLGRPVPCDVYKRLADLEEKILHLEGLSPEYFRQNVSINSTSESES